MSGFSRSDFDVRSIELTRGRSLQRYLVGARSTEGL